MKYFGWQKDRLERNNRNGKKSYYIVSIAVAMMPPVTK